MPPPQLPGDSADTPDVHPPVVSKAPPPGRKFPCSQCGSRLEFDPSSQALKCPYCGHVTAIERASAADRENDLEEALRGLKKHHRKVEGRVSEAKCPSCAAIVMVQEKVASDKCPYCGTFLENQPESAEHMLRPDGVLPFAIDQRSAVEGFTKWLHGLWFAPSELRQLANLGRLNGLYVPFWTYDSMTYTWYDGERGDDYTVSETYTETNAQGQTETKTRQVTKTRWHNVSGQVQHFFDDVLICGSKSLPEHHVVAVMPSRLEELEEFRPDFLSGFQAERYTVGPEEGWSQAQKIMDGRIRQLCRRDIGGDHQKLHTVDTRHVGVTFKHILLPVWTAYYKYREQTYQVLINGQTGQVVGDRPYSWMKIVGLILTILVLIAAIFVLFAFLSGR